MLEALAHRRLKEILHHTSSSWPNHLTLCRLIARSLRRSDHTLLHMEPGSKNEWWLGLLVPLCLESRGNILVLTPSQRRRLFDIEFPRLQQVGVKVGYWEGEDPPLDERLWLLDYSGLLKAYKQGYLKTKKLIIPEAERLTDLLRKAMAIHVKPEDWEKLRKSEPALDGSLLQFYEELTRRLFTKKSRFHKLVRIYNDDMVELKSLLSLSALLLNPWSSFLKHDPNEWAGWAELDSSMLSWDWHYQPLEPLKLLPGLLTNQSTLLMTESGKHGIVPVDLNDDDFQPTVLVNLSNRDSKEPISLFAPLRQPLPNTEIYAEYLLDQSRRLIFGRQGLTVILLDDSQLRLKLTSQLASEFGKRVVHQTQVEESNGVICCCWSWWLNSLDSLPCPDQLIIGLIPLASLESPLIAARVEAMKRNGQDWFRDFLLPKALSLIPPAVASLRSNSGRLAILDGRLRRRSWGDKILQVLEPWTPLHRLLPN